MPYLQNDEQFREEIMNGLGYAADGRSSIAAVLKSSKPFPFAILSRLCVQCEEGAI